MINKKPMISLLIALLSVTAAQVTYAEGPANQLELRSYRCSSITEPLHRVNVNLGERRGFVQLDIPVANSQPVSISALKQCLFQNGLMSRQEFVIYSPAVEACRRAHEQKKVQFSQDGITNISTSKAFNFDQCLQDKLLN